MKLVEMVEKFICPGCVSGSDTKCSVFDNSDENTCKNHVLGTCSMVGSFALGLPKGFNKAAYGQNKMHIFCWAEGTKLRVDKFNVPVWALEKDGYLFIRMYSPRINTGAVHVVENGKLDMVPGAIDISSFLDEMD